MLDKDVSISMVNFPRGYKAVALGTIEMDYFTLYVEVFGITTRRSKLGVGVERGTGLKPLLLDCVMHNALLCLLL